MSPGIASIRLRKHANGRCSVDGDGYEGALRVLWGVGWKFKAHEIDEANSRDTAPWPACMSINPMMDEYVKEQAVKRWMAIERKAYFLSIRG
ncbi:uncharacterized protein BCR38DRAFT_94943 [Pseudomassariella vexata]|uniref:Uncharacterized protein n=1 Tax=Pseudomassariella vexata TaxID=1141098 RepID=A0A1Y2EE97_9PEZI|nr:uncharacterized protein BCR38DRAFT_94943 [Pseudomassariella vexata]ORY69898.1 hypothetical protein BCR38DRAFT_94943 [Pseudomassariella vexata]